MWLFALYPMFMIIKRDLKEQGGLERYMTAFGLVYHPQDTFQDNEPKDFNPNSTLD